MPPALPAWADRLLVLSSFRSAAALGRSISGNSVNCPTLDESLRWLRERGISAAASNQEVSDKQLAEIVAEACSRDFQLGKVVRIQGWMLAETEVAICCIANVMARRQVAR